MSEATDALGGAGPGEPPPAHGRLAALARLGRNALIYGAGQATTRLVALIMLPIATAYLGPAEYGLLAILTFAGLLARSMLGLGVTPALGIVYFDRPDAGHKASTLRTAEVLMSALAGLVALVGVLLAIAAPRLGFMPAAATPVLIVLQFAITALQLATDPLLMRLQFDDRPQAYVLLGLLGAALGAALGVLLLALGQGVGGLLLGNLIGAAASFVAARALAAADPVRADRTTARRLLGLGLPLVPGALFVMLIFNAAPVVLSRWASLDEAGLFAVGSQLGNALLLAVAACTTAWHPFFLSYKTRQREASAVFPLVTTAYVAAFGLAVLLFFVLARPVVRILAAETFWPAYRVVGALAASQAMLGFWSLLLPGVYYAEATRLVLLAQVAAAAACLGAQLMLIPHLGSEGAGLGILAGTAALVFAQLAVNRWRRFDVDLAIGRCLAMIAVTGLAAAAQRVLVDGPLTGWAAAVASLGLVLVTAALLLALLPPDARRRLVELVRQSTPVAKVSGQ